MNAPDLQAVRTPAAPEAPAPFTGREVELEQALRALTQVKVVMLEGMPGIGKTSLMARLAARCAEGDEARRPVWVSLQSPTDLWERLDLGLQAAGISDLGACLRQTTLGQPERLAVLCGLLRRERALLLVDDVHLMGEVEAAGFVRQLATYLGSSRAVVSTRVRLPTGLTDGIESAEFALGGLPGAKSVELLSSLLAEQGALAAEPSLAALAASAGGHPLWLKLAAGLILAERLRPEELLRPFDGARVELGKRLLERAHASLPLSEKRLLARLAVFRGAADPEALAALVGPELLELMGRLEDRFLLERLPAGQACLHPVVREFCLGRLPDSERHLLWMDLANWYESRGAEGDRLAAQLEAYHYCILAGEDGKAYRLLLEFAEPLLLRGRTAELAPMLDRALGCIFEPDLRLVLTKARLLRNQGRAAEARALLAAVPQPAGVRDRVLLGSERGLLEQDAGRYDRALKQYYAGLDLAKQLDDPLLSASLLARIATICKDRGDYDRAIRLYEQVAELERACGTNEGVAFALHNLAKIRYAQGEHDRALDAHRQALELWEQAGDRLSALLARNGIANVLRDRGEVAEAETMYSRNLAEYRALANPFGESYTLANLGHLHLLRGEPREAQELLDRALGLARSMGNRLGEALSLDKLGDVRRATGRLSEARELYGQALAIKRELHNDYGMSITLNCLGDLARESGEYRQADAFYDEALALARRLRDKDGIARSLEGRAILAGDRGDFAQARSQLEEALALRRHLDEKRGIGRALSQLGHLAGQSGEVERAFQFYREGMELFQRLANKKEIQRTLGCLAQLHANLGEYPRAAALAAESLELSRKLEDPKGEAVALTQLGQIALYQRELNRARQWLEASLSLRESISDSRGLVASLEPLALCLLESGGYDEAAALLGRATTLAEGQGFPKLALQCRAHSALLALRKGQLDTAGELLEGLLDRALQAGFSEGVAYVYRLNGFLAYRRGQPELAAELLRQSSDLYRKLAIGREQARVERELEDVGKDRLLGRLERRSTMLENSRRLEGDLLSSEGRVVTAMVVDRAEQATGLPPGVKQDRRAAFREPHSPLAELISRSGGRPLRVVGQALLAVFEDPALAVETARQIQSQAASLGLAARGARIGLHHGRLLEVGAELFGDTHGLAARFHGLAQPGETLLSADVLDPLSPKPATVEAAPQKVRGRSEPLRLYRLEG